MNLTQLIVSIVSIIFANRSGISFISPFTDMHIINDIIDVGRNLRNSLTQK